MLSFIRPLAVAEPAQVAEHALPYPLVPCPPIAVFSQQFAVAPSVIPVKDVSDLKRVGARTVAAPLTILRSIDPSCWTPEFPVIVLSRSDRGLLEERERDYLWDRFRVPVFDYLVNGSGRLLAEE